MAPSIFQSVPTTNAAPNPLLNPILSSLMQNGKATPGSVQQAIQANEGAAVGTTSNAPSVSPPGATASPLHDVVRQLFVNHPDKTPDQIAQGLTAAGKVDPALAQRVVGDVAAERRASASTAPNAPPYNPSQFNATLDSVIGKTPPPNAPPTPSASSMIASSLPARSAVNAPPAPSMVAAHNAAMGTMQNAADTGARVDTPRAVRPGVTISGGLTPADAPPSSAGGGWSSPSTSPSASTNAPPSPPTNADAPPVSLNFGVKPTNAPTPLANAPAATATLPNLPYGVDNMARQAVTPQTLSSVAPYNAPPTKPDDAKGPSLLQRLAGVLLPVGAALAVGRNNPYAGGALLSGYQQGQERQRTANLQQAEMARQARQDEQARQQQQFENDLKTKAENDTESFHKQMADAATQKASTQLTNDEMKQMEAIPDGDSALKLYDNLYPHDEKGLRAAFLDENGQPKQWNPFSQNAAKDQINEAANYAKQNHWSAQDTVAATRAAAYAQQVGARVDELEALAGLDKSKSGYVDAQTKEYIPAQQALIRLHNAQSTFLGVRTQDQPGLDASLEDYRGALGAAAGENADTNRYNARTRAAVANADISRIAAATGVDEARIKEIAGKDPNFTTAVQLLKGAEDRKQKAMLSSTLDDTAKKAIIAAENHNIQQYNSIINARLTGSQNITSVPPSPANPGSIQVPDVPAPGGNQTPRSQAFRNGAVTTQRIERASGTTVPNNSAYQCGAWLSKMLGSPGIATRSVKDQGNRIQPDANGNVPDGTIVFWPGGDGKPVGESPREHFGRVYTAVDGVQRVQESTTAGAPKGSRIIRTDETPAQITARHGVQPQYYRVAGTSSNASPQPSPAAPASNPTQGHMVLVDSKGRQFNAPTTKAEFDALTPAQRHGYARWYNSQHHG